MTKSVNRKTKRAIKKRPDSKLALCSCYEVMEPRRVLAALFPTYINGEFTLGNGPDADSPYDLSDTFELSSLPSATKTIYLDNDGHHSFNNSWGHDIIFDPFDTDGNPNSFSDDELIEIQMQFQNMAEDFLPFNVNVTTKDPGLDALLRSDQNDDEYGIRVVNTQGTPEFSGFCGIAFLNSFGSDIDNPVFTICKGTRNGALVHSHETGHALGLRHDGLDGAAYHPGAGSGENSWGPIMGAPFDARITQWSDGNYAGSTNTEDDFQIITTQNGFGFRPDDFGNTIGTASELEPDLNGKVFSWGIIEQNTDIDVFEFSVASGDVSFTIKSFEDAANLDVLATIRDANGNVLFTSDPEPGLNAGFDVTLPAGTFYLTVEGTDQSGLYNDYGSVGLYIIEGVGVVNGVPVGETGRIVNLTDLWRRVDLSRTYEDPVVVAGPSSRVGAAPVTVRVRNVTSSSFEVRIDEWDYLDGRHRNGETVDYMVVEAGEYKLDDGTIIMAGNRSAQNHRWTTNSLSDAFNGVGEPPVILTQTVTENDPAAVTTRTRRVSATEFQMRLQEEQANTRGSHGYETVSWIAIQQNFGNLGLLRFESGRTGNEVANKRFDLLFQTNFDSPPAFLANMQTFNGGDTATVRYHSLTADGSVIYVEEERSLDNEIIHNPESVGYLAIEIGEIYGQAEGLFASNYDLLVGNLSKFQGNYPDYSEALKLVRERDANAHQHSLLNDLHDHPHFGSDHVENENADKFLNLVRLDSALTPSIGTDLELDSRFDALDAHALTELAGAIIADLPDANLGSEWLPVGEQVAEQIGEFDLGFDLV